MEVVGLLFLFLVLFSTAHAVYAAFCTWSFFRNKERTKGEDSAFPPVSVIKPVAGMEEGYRENFMSFCLQDYPAFELVFALPHKIESLISLLAELKARFPHVNLDWVFADFNKGPNYKVRNLIAAVRKAKHSVLVISDSDMRVGTQYLRQIVAPFLQERVGLVTALYRNTRLGCFRAALQALTVQTIFVPNVIFSRKMEGMSYAFGATLCTSKDILESVGGMEIFLDYLADDYQMGYRVYQKGYDIHLSSDLIDQVSHITTFKEYFTQQLRAGITQRVCRPVGYFGSVLTHSVSLALVFVLVEGFSFGAWVLFFSVSTIRILSAGLLNKTTIHNRELNRYLWSVPFNDLMNTIIWLLSLFTNTVRWKERRFRVLKGGKMVEL